ncbi:hypothetical protein [Bartonella machadoae]|nr:hypothetical protein [Bartonella machadoae]
MRKEKEKTAQKRENKRRENKLVRTMLKEKMVAKCKTFGEK